MKKVFLIILTLAFFTGCGKPFEETYKQSIEDLKSKKSQAIPFDEFYTKYFKDKTELQIKAQKEEWEKNNSFPIISFNEGIVSIKDVEYSSIKMVKNNKEKFADVLLVYKMNYKSIYLSLSSLKKDAMELKKDAKLKGYGQIYSFSTKYDEFFIHLYPVIIE